MPSPTRRNSLCAPPLIIKYKSPFGAPSVPALPFPASRILCPSRVPALMLNDSGSRFVTTPAPSHVGEAFCPFTVPRPRALRALHTPPQPRLALARRTLLLPMNLQPCHTSTNRSPEINLNLI